MKPLRRRCRAHGPIDKRMSFEDESPVIFQQDHASTHYSHVAMEYLEQKGITVISRDTPAKMDNVWCIERVWVMMDVMIYKRPKPKTVEELTRRAKTAWQSIQVDTSKTIFITCSDGMYCIQ